MKRFLCILLCCSLATSSAAQNLPDLGESAQAGFSVHNERKLGELIMRELRRDPAFMDDAEVQWYIESIGRRLATANGESAQPLEFFALRDSSINAFAMPGGFIGVHSGLMLAAQSESEVASVIAHEIAHVTQRHIARQLEKQSQLQMAAIAGFIIALLAARSNAQVSQAALATSQAGAIQAALNYSRDLEREADRLGFQMLDGAGFDVSGMPAFFERLQRATRLQESNAPAYLRTHPLNTERIADMQNRASERRYRQHADPTDFHLARAKLRALQGNAFEAANAFEVQLREKRFSSEIATRYGLTLSWLRARELAKAEAELGRLRALQPRHWMVDTLEAALRLDRGNAGEAQKLLAASLKSSGGLYPVRYAYIETMQVSNRHAEALTELDTLLKERPRDTRAYGMQAKSYAATGKRALQHRSQSEVYYLQGALPAAIEQLTLAQRAGDADFYAMSVIDSRLRVLRAEWAEERKQRGFGAGPGPAPAPGRP